MEAKTTRGCFTPSKSKEGSGEGRRKKRRGRISKRADFDF